MMICRLGDDSLNPILKTDTAYQAVIPKSKKLKRGETKSTTFFIFCEKLT